jgi:hypothetical protein
MQLLAGELRKVVEPESEPEPAQLWPGIPPAPSPEIKRRRGR